jgi:hypothetical protein
VVYLFNFCFNGSLEFSFTNDHGHVLFVVITIPSFPLLWLITKSTKYRQYNGQTKKDKHTIHIMVEKYYTERFSNTNPTKVLSVLRWFTASDNPFGIFWPLYCQYFVDLQFLITPLVSFDHCIVCTLQWSKDTKGVIRSRDSKKYWQYNGQKIPKGLSEAVNLRSTDNTSYGFW